MPTAQDDVVATAAAAAMKTAHSSLNAICNRFEMHQIL